MSPFLGLRRPAPSARLPRTASTQPLHLFAPVQLVKGASAGIPSARALDLALRAPANTPSWQQDLRHYTAGFTRSFGPRLRRLPCQCVHERPAITHGQQNLPLSWKHQRFAFLSVVAHCAAAQVSSGPWAPECSLRRVASRMPPASPVYNIWEFCCQSERMRLIGSEAAQPVWYAGSHLRQSPQLMQLLLLLVLVGLSWAQDVQM